MINCNAGGNPLRDCRAIVSGAAGTVGEQCARELASYGIELILADIDRMMVNRLADQLGAKAHGLDVLSDASVRQLMKSIDDRPGCGNLLVNAAGAGYARTQGMSRFTAAFARLTNAASTTVVNVASTGSTRDADKQAGLELAFHRMSASLADAVGGRDMQILTFGSTAPAYLIVDALRQWHGICCDEPMSRGNNSIALTAGGKQ